MSNEAKKTKTFASIFGEDFEGFNNNENDFLANTLPINQLIHFEEHPFKLYEGERKKAMIDSINQYGVIMPIVVRKKGTKYEILSGHNRVEACKVLNMQEIPVVIKDGLSDDEAMLIVTESNTMQRSITELPHSERATIISVRHEAMKKQGVRNDLLKEIERLTMPNIINEDETCSPMGNKLKTMDKVANEYGMSKNSVARYLRISKLPHEYKALIDDGKIAIRAGVELSYMKKETLEILMLLLEEGKYKLDIKKAKVIRIEDSKDNISYEKLLHILTGSKPSKDKKKKAPKFWNEIYIKYFIDIEKEEEISDIIENAVALYFERKESGNSKEE